MAPSRAMVRGYLSFPPLSLDDKDAEPLAQAPQRPICRPIPKAFPKWWIALRVIQLFISCVSFITTLWAFKYLSLATQPDAQRKGNHGYGYGGYHHREHSGTHGHMKCAVSGLVFITALPMLYILATILLRSRHPVGFAKCVPFVFAGDVLMMGIFGGIKAGAKKMLKLVWAHGYAGDRGLFKGWVKKGCKYSFKGGKVQIKQWGKQWGKEWKHGDWKAWLKDFKDGAAGGKIKANAGDGASEARKKAMFFVTNALRTVKRMSGWSTFLFFLSALVALYILITHRGQIKKHLSEVRESLRARCRARRMRRCARRAARATRRARAIPKCCDHKCPRDIAPEFHSNEKSTPAWFSSVDVDPTRVSLPVVADAFPVSCVPGALPAASAAPAACPPSPLPRPEASEVSYGESTPALSGIHTPMTRSASTVSSVTLATRTEGDLSTDDEFTHVEYRHVRTPSTSSGSEVGAADEVRRPLL